MGIHDDDTQGPSNVPHTLAGASITNREATPSRIDSGPRSAPLTPGFHLGTRYVIHAAIGGGGMGEVYEAGDLELDRLVALKIIRPNLAEDPQVLARFRREAQLSSQITHPNVVRVYDVGEAGGARFITMQLVKGEDLGALLKRERKLEWPKAVEIAHQIALGLDAAHVRGVVHRDLKPRNVLLDESGQVYVADFGLATAIGGEGATGSGELLGSPAYMAPEQVKGERVDARADVYALGVILYQMVAGELPFRGGTQFEIMSARLHKAPQPLRELAPEVPAPVVRVIDGCMTIARKKRFETARQVADALDLARMKVVSQDGPSGSMSTRRSRIPSQPASRRTIALGAALCGVAALAGALGVWRFGRPAVRAPQVASVVAPPVPAPQDGPVGTPSHPVRVLVGSFANRTGETVLDDALEEPFELVLAGTPVVTTISRARAVADVKRADPSVAPLQAWLAVARESKVRVLVTGEVTSKGDGSYRLAVDLVDAASGRPLRTQERVAANAHEVLVRLGELAVLVREALGDTSTPEQKAKDARVFAASTLQATRQYQLLRERVAFQDFDGALHAGRRAVDLDPGLAPGYVEIAYALSNANQLTEADKYFALAFAHTDRLTERELFWARGAYFTFHPSKDLLTLSREYADRYPGDPDALIYLSVAYGILSDFPHALEWGKRAVEIEPTRSDARVNISEFAVYTGERDAAVLEAKEALRLSPSCDQCYFVLGIEATVAGDHATALKAYDDARAVGGSVAAVTAEGPADLALYEGRVEDAIDALRAGIGADLHNHLPDLVPVKLAVLAEAELAAGQRADAKTSAERALASSKQVEVLFVAGRVLATLGDDARVEQAATALARGTRPDARAYAELLRGEALLARGRAREAADRFEAARDALDVWYAHYALARAYVQLGDFARAATEIDTATRRKGEALALMTLTFTPTTRYWPPVVYWRARVEEGLGRPSAAASYREYLALRGKADHDDLAADAAKRVEALEGPAKP